MAALLAALETVTLPGVSLHPDTGAVTVDLAVRRPLTLHSRPVSCTSAVFPAKEGEVEARVLADPTWEEEQLAGASLSVVSMAGGEVCHLRQPGGKPLSQDTLQACLLAAQAQSKVIIQAMDKMKK